MLANQTRPACILLMLPWLLGGCGLFSERDPQPAPAAASPHEAFEQVGEPNSVSPGPGPADPDGLSSDIERLQDARRKYEHDKSQEGRELRRRQKACADNPDNRKVPIEGDALGGDFCQESAP